MAVVKKMQNTRFYAILLMTITIAGALSIYPVISQLMEHYRIENSGVITGTNIIALSGSVEDIQAAVDAVAAEGGGIVIIPAGDWTWPAGDQTVEVPGGVSVFGSGYSGDVGRLGRGTASFNTILRLPYANNPTWTAMFYCDGANGLPIRISGLALIGRGTDSSAGDTAIRIEAVKDFRVDHCRIEGLGSNGIAVGQFSNTGTSGPPDPNWKLCQGVIDHCDIIDTLANPAVNRGTGYGYGIAMDKREGTDLYVWYQTAEELAGKYFDNTYVEDCYFDDPRHAICNVLGSTSVFRYNYVDYNERADDGGNWIVDQHPPRTYTGGRWMEVYNNEFHAQGPQWCWGYMGYYGGGGVCFNNIVYTEGSMYYLYTFGSSDSTTSEIWNLGRTTGVWVWDETIIGGYSELIYGPNAPGGYSPPVEGVDFHFREPTVQQDGWAYTPYTYPHPLTLGSWNGAEYI